MRTVPLRIAPCALAVGLLVAGTPLAAPVAGAEAADDEQVLRNTGLKTDGPALLAFFRTRSRTEADRDRLHDCAGRFTGPVGPERAAATSELIAWGPLAVPVLRQVANDLDNPEAAARARRCLDSLQGPTAAALPAAVARLLAVRKPDGAVEALLAYLPLADDAETVAEITSALAALAASSREPNSALLRALVDPSAARRAAACVALCRAGSPGRWPAVRTLLKDPTPAVRLRAALALAEAQDADAVPVLIDLLADLAPGPRAEAEERLRELAGDWAPVIAAGGEDDVARRIRRDAWAGWWRNTDGPALLAAVRKRTLTPADRQRIRDLIRRLGDEAFAVREKASNEMVALGTMALPLLQQARRSSDPEVARRAEECLGRIVQEPSHRLPVAALRLLVLRKPAGTAEVLLAYLPCAEDESLAAEAMAALAGVAQRDGQPEPALLKALEDADPATRGNAAEALARGGGPAGVVAAGKLLRDADMGVRLQTSLALVAAGERAAVPVLVDLVAVLPGDRAAQAEDALHTIAGDKAPALPEGAGEAVRKKHRDAWAAWWKEHGAAAELGRAEGAHTLLGYTLVIGGSSGKLTELGRDGKPRWTIDGLQFPVDAFVLGNNRVLIAEYNGRRITERDFKGNIVWSKDGLNGQPVNVQRLPNGHTFIATDGQILEVDRSGKEVFSVATLGALTAAYRTRTGHVIVLTANGQCVRLDSGGKQVKSFPSNRNPAWTSGLDLLANGHILITQPNRGKVAEVDAEGRVLAEFDTPGVVTATGLPNGHVLAALENGQRICEVDRKGKVVWEYKEGNSVFRARRR
jgi:HEAT repeat protein